MNIRADLSSGFCIMPFKWLWPWPCMHICYGGFLRTTWGRSPHERHLHLCSQDPCCALDQCQSVLQMRPPTQSGTLPQHSAAPCIETLSMGSCVAPSTSTLCESMSCTLQLVSTSWRLHSCNWTLASSYQIAKQPTTADVFLVIYCLIIN